MDIPARMSQGRGFGQAIAVFGDCRIAMRPAIRIAPNVQIVPHRKAKTARWSEPEDVSRFLPARESTADGEAPVTDRAGTRSQAARLRQLIRWRA